MDLSNLLATVRSAKLDRFTDFFVKYARPAIEITRGQGVPVLAASRFGGLPDTPPDFEWPRFDAGECRFLGQINFADLARFHTSLPKDGLLSLYYAHDESGEVFWGDPGFVQARYFGSVKQLVRASAPPDGHSVRSYNLQFRLTIGLPYNKDYVPDWPFSRSDVDAYDKIRSTLLRSCDYLLGYPSHGTLAYDPTPGPEWLALLCIGSADELEWCWADGDRLTLFIQGTSLATADFSTLKAEAG